MVAQVSPLNPWQHEAGHHLSLLFDVFALGQQVRTLLSTAMQEAGLRPDEYAAYSVVFESGPVTMTVMARELGMPVTTASDYVRAMIARGHLRRDRNPEDHRSYLLTLTAKGKRAHRTASAGFERAHQALTRALPPLKEDSARKMLQQLTESAVRAIADIGATEPFAQRSDKAVKTSP
jgi:DNA-binding MarR family transcriptional regulator